MNLRMQHNRKGWSKLVILSVQPVQIRSGPTGEGAGFNVEENGAVGRRGSSEQQQCRAVLHPAYPNAHELEGTTGKRKRTGGKGVL